MDNDNHRYDDIIDLPHHISPTRPRMSLYNRAVQFAPFAALNGYEEAVDETARLTESRLRLTEEECLTLSKKISYLIDNSITDEVEITYFIPDHAKAGGRHATVSGAIRRVEPALNQLILRDKRIIPLNSICAIKGEPLRDFDE